MKDCTRKLRQILRRQAAAKNEEVLEDIMHSEDNGKTFYKLINIQRSSLKTTTNCFDIKGKLLTSDKEMTEGWAEHLEYLATPKSNSSYDNEFLRKAQEDVKMIENLDSDKNLVLPVSKKEIIVAIKQLHNNKAADYIGLQAEHLKYGGEPMLAILRLLINQIFSMKHIPESLKIGTISPIFKKGDNKEPDNYRGIAVTPILLKVIEHVLNQRHKHILYSTQSRLQSGFIKGTSSIRSALIISECKMEAKLKKEKLYFVTLDTRKAFDVVNHDLLLRNFFLDKIPLAEWMLPKDSYTNMSACVKWQNLMSRPFSIKQGVRQGGVLSTEHYEGYNNPLLIKLETNFKGAKIGNICIPHTTCADDVALLSHSKSEPDQMLQIVGSFNYTHRYDINSQKSACLVFNNKRNSDKMKLMLNNDPIPVSDSTTHLGLKRELGECTDIDRKIELGRRTAYSLLGAGFHGFNGLKQDKKAHT